MVTIVCGVVAFILAAGFFNWVQVALRDSTIYSSLGHFQISRAGYNDKGIADPYQYLIDPADPDLIKSKQYPGVEAMSPRLALSGLISLRDKTIGFLGEGIDPVDEAVISQWLLIQPGGQNLKQRDEKGLILGVGLAAALDAKVGDTVVLLANKAGGGQNAVEAVVSGTFVTSTKAYDDAYLRLPIKLAQQLIQTSGATVYVGILKQTEDTDRVIAGLRSQLPAERFEIIPWYEKADFYKKSVALFSSQLNVIRVIIVLIILLSIANTLSMSVIERTSEIGTSLATGSRRSDILQLFLSEGAMLGAVGGLAGVFLGALLAYLISYVGIPMPPPPGASFGYTGQIKFSLPIALDAWLLAVAATLLAGTFPAWRASRLNIVDALRHGR